MQGVRTELAPPPASWRSEYATLAADAGALARDVDAASALLAAYWVSVIGGLADTPRKVARLAPHSESDDAQVDTLHVDLSRHGIPLRFEVQVEIESHAEALCADHSPRAHRRVTMIATPDDLRAVTGAFDDLAVYTARIDRGLPASLAAFQSERWDEQRGLNDKLSIVPGAGEVGEALDNAWC